MLWFLSAHTRMCWCGDSPQPAPSLPLPALPQQDQSLAHICLAASACRSQPRPHRLEAVAALNQAEILGTGCSWGPEVTRDASCHLGNILPVPACKCCGIWQLMVSGMEKMSGINCQGSLQVPWKCNTMFVKKKYSKKHIQTKSLIFIILLIKLFLLPISPQK